MPVPLRATLLLLGLSTLASCATLPTKPEQKPERLEFEPVVIAPTKQDLELTNLNDEELFALGTSEYAAKSYDRAALCFTRLADLFPKSPHHDEAMYNAGLAYERLERFADALERFKPLMDPEKGKGDALDAAFRAAECYYHLDDYAPAIAILNAVAEREDVGTQERLQAKVQKGVCLLESGDPDAAERSLRDALNYYGQRKETEAFDDYLPGQAQFFLGEVYRGFFDKVDLDPEKGEDKLGKDLEYKCEMLLSAQGHYLRAIRIGHAQWATAAGFRVGEMYETLYDAMLHAKIPPGFDEEQTRIYREELRKKVKVLVTKAMGIYERTLAAAERIGADNPFVERTRQSLDRMRQILLEEEAPAGEPAKDVQPPASPASQANPTS